MSAPLPPVIPSVKPNRRQLLLGGAAAVAAVAVSNALPVMTPEAQAASNGFGFAFQANTGKLWWSTSDDHTRGMMAGTNPAIVRVDRGYQMAYQSNGGVLMLHGDAVSVNTGLGMMAKTSPSVCRLSNGRVIAAFQSIGGNLCIWDSKSGVRNLGLGMKTGTSPSIAPGPDGEYRIAFQANTGNLWCYYSKQNAGSDQRLGMMAGTSPSIAWVGKSGFRTAFQANTGELWINGNSREGTRLGAKMAAGTSPSIAKAYVSDVFRIAYHGADSSLWHYDSAKNVKSSYVRAMEPGTSPAITGLAAGGYQVAFQAKGTSLFLVGNGNRTGNMGFGMKLGTSPAICADTMLTFPSSTPTTTPGDIAVKEARTYIGTPYVLGGASRAGIDCSGLTMRAWEKAGVSLTHQSRAQYGQGKKIARGQARPGDLLFWSSNGAQSGIYHVAIYVGGGQLIDAPAPGRVVSQRAVWTSQIMPYAVRPK